MGGKLIVFEGVEGCGKTTQLQRSWQWLQSLPTSCPLSKVVVTREPGGTELGLKLRQLLLQTEGKPMQDLAELLLYAADRAQHVEEVLKPHLADSALVLCDRYTDSTIAYQGYGRGLSLGLIEQLNQIATSGLESDLTLWLDVDVAQGLARAKGRSFFDRIEQAELTFHQRVQLGYGELAKAHPQRIVRVNASLDEVAVQEQIQAILWQRLPQWYEGWES
ncbi:MAG: dTMP kinase [Chroococcidiopsidaceae cyanobacterium CP_BM_ER_R8_30]|nr:dTMP kinase [Chroococcidiopsidaceae cyanobacterium CP_BM_ER_R8_30]